MCTGGYIKIYRTIWDWEWHDDPLMFSLWVFLLTHANYEDKKWHGLDIERGQLVCSVTKIKDITGLSVQQIRSRLRKLVDCNQITIETTNQYSIITICNYESYQGEGDDEQQTKQQANNKRATNEQQTDNKQITTTKEIEEIKNIEKEIYKERNFVPPTIDEVREYVKVMGYDIDPEAWWNFYESKGWMIGKNKMKKWHSAVVTWAKKDNNAKRTNDARRGTDATALTKEDYSTSF